MLQLYLIPDDILAQIFRETFMGEEMREVEVMKINKIIVGTLLVSVLLTGCEINPAVAVYSNDEKIASELNTFNLDAVEQEITDGQMTANVGRMEGMETIWSYSSEEDKEVDISYNLSVYSGKLKMALITPDGEVNVIEECDAEMKEPLHSTLNIQSGVNRIKLVAGKDTKFDIEVAIAEGDFLKIGF